MLVSLLSSLAIIFLPAWYRIAGDSMLPSLAHGDLVLVVRALFSRKGSLRRGDVVVFERPENTYGSEDSTGLYIKRVIGLPGEDIKVAGGRVFLDGEILVEEYIRGPGPTGGGGMTEGEEQWLAGDAGAGTGRFREWFTGPDEYFLLGDNRAASGDSRAFGPVPERLIKGRAWFRCWPVTRWRFFGGA
ncbi:MAG: signal peptidase I [Chloroflexi bacterium]|nr:signal peptidase I [Chloroflexota bacterium]MDA1271814.1 signal peptidase I [Chloroflexota bacterium]PKB58308.1 MAG: signal peptidase I [SAR202 cluster bacterium Casp-Chloro-G2]